MSTLFFGNNEDLKARRVLVFDIGTEGVAVRAFPGTPDDFSFNVTLTGRSCACFRLAARHVFNYRRFMPDGVRERVLDVPAPAIVRRRSACANLV